MPLKPEHINFLLNNLSKSDYRTYKSIISQVFKYLEDNIKDNPVYDNYLSRNPKWLNWIHNIKRVGAIGDWAIPESIDDNKELAFAFYDYIGKLDKRSCDQYLLSVFNLPKFDDILLKVNGMFLGYFRLVIDEIINANPEIDSRSPKHILSDTVFIVHGHDEHLKTEVQLLLNRAGVNSIVLHEQLDRGRTIIDKLVEEAAVSGYAIGLFTPDDLINNGQSRARQNVILEIGYFLGLLGKERTRMIVKGEVEIPSDLHGILYQKYDSAGAWKTRLLKEIRGIGIYVDFESVINKI